MTHNEISGVVVDAALKVHRRYGPGLLESAYRGCLAYELKNRGLQVLTEVPIPLIHEGVKLNVAYRIDILVEGLVVVEVKAVNGLLPVHKAQLLSHLKLNDFRFGLLINFHEEKLKNGIVRMANNL